MSSLLSRSLNYCNDFSVGGITELYFANKAYVTDYFFTVSDYNLSNITSLTVSPLIDWYHWTVINQAALSNEKLSKTSFGKVYSKSFELVISKMESDKRDSIYEILNAELVCVYKDYNGAWFIMGEDYGVRVIEYSATSDKLGGNNQYRIVLETTEKDVIRSLSPAYVEANILTAAGGNTDCYFFVDNDTFDASLFYSTLLYTVEGCSLEN